MIGRAINGRDGAVADDEGADIAPGLVDIFLHVISVMVVIAERLPVFQDRFGAVSVVDARQAAAPRNR